MLCPVVKGCEQLVLFGDDHQLGPTVVTQDRAAAALLGRSLFQRLVDSGEIAAHTLAVQYRMHPSIAAWPSQHYYAGHVQDGVAAAARPAPPGLAWPAGPEHRVVFLPSSARERATPDRSYCNDGEAATVVALVQHLLRAGLACNDIGVITPYAAQVRLIADRLRTACGIDVDSFRTESEDCEDDDDGNGDGNGGAADAAAERPVRQSVAVYSVDGFQGREKNVIVFSAVRSNDARAVGFLADWRRSNVMLTRARNALFVVGNAPTLALDEHWRMWLDYVNANHLATTLPALLGESLALLPPPTTAAPSSYSSSSSSRTRSRGRRRHRRHSRSHSRSRSPHRESSRDSHSSHHSRHRRR